MDMLPSYATAPKVPFMTSAYEAGQIPPVLLRHRLRIAREFAGYEQDELAEIIGVSRNTIGNAEVGRVKPRKITLRAWAFHCEVPLSWIEGDDQSPHHPQDGPRGARRPTLETDEASALVMRADVDIPQHARLVVVDEDGAVVEDATLQIASLTTQSEQSAKSVTLRLTAERNCQLCYGGLQDDFTAPSDRADYRQAA
jgi:DNA-binding XRE family transcriptional regulator